MNTTEKIVTASIGLIMIIGAFGPGVAFYPRALGIGGNRSVPKWFGRVWFVLFGVWFILIGISSNEHLGKLTAGIFAIILGSIVIYSGVAGPRQEGKRVWRQVILSLSVGILFLLGAWELILNR